MRRLAPYLWTLAAVAAATVLRALLDPFLGDAIPYATYFIAVAAGAWFAGLSGGLLATLVGGGLAYYFFVPPRYAFGTIPGPDMFGLVVYLIAGSLISILGDQIQNAQRRVDLQRKVLHVTLDSIGDAVISTDTEGKVVFLNPVAERLTGWPVADAEGKPLEEVFRIVNEDTRQCVENPAVRALREGAIVGLANHTLLIARDGCEHPIDDSAAPIRDSEGVVSGAVLVFRDVGQARRAQRAESMLAAIVQSSDDAVVSKTLDGIIRSWNAGAERIFGYSEAEAVGQPIELIIPEHLRDEERSIIERLRRGERVEHFETQRAAKDGRLLDISLTISPVRDKEGRVTGASKVARDITGRKLLESALERSETRLARMFEAALDCIISIDREGKIIEFNGAAERTFGHRRDQVIGRELASVCIPPTYRDAHRQGLSHYLATGQGPVLNRRLELTALHAGGSEFPIELTVIPVATEGPPTFTAFLRDITDRKQLEAELREHADVLSDADRRKNEFLATLAHELRNPLAPIRNAVELLRNAQEDPARVERARTLMERQIVHMVRLIDDLLDVGRITSGKFELQREDVELKTALDQALESARPFLERSDHRLTLQLPEKAVHLHADPVRLSQIFANLLTNAAKYTDTGGDIMVSAQVEAEEVLVSVRDTGVGIERKDLSKLFEMFSQISPSHGRSDGGLGIGLALVKGLVEMHGGSIRAESEGRGKGSIFTVRLPLASPSSAPGDGAGSDSDRMKPPSRRILVVDDNRDSADSLAELLRIYGSEVEVCYDGVAALESAERIRPDMVLLDLGMPNLDGYEVCRRLKAQPWAKQTFIIAQTGWGGDRDREKTTEAGFDAHLVKPVDPDQLLELLAQVSEDAR